MMARRAASGGGGIGSSRVVGGRGGRRAAHFLRSASAPRSKTDSSSRVPSSRLCRAAWQNRARGEYGSFA